MADKKYISANIAYQTDTFGAWVERTNQMVFDMSERVVTSQVNSIGAATTGNVVITSNVWNSDTSAYVNSTGGVLQANTLTAYGDLRGGSVDTSAVLVVSSNSHLSGNTTHGVVAVTSNTTYGAGRVTTKGDYVDMQSTNTFVNGSLLQVSSNVHINSTSTNASINATTTHIDGTTLNLKGTTLNANYDNIVVTANDQSFKSNSSVTAFMIDYDGTSTGISIPAGNTFVVDADETTFNANVSLGSANDDTVSFLSEVDTGINPVSNALSLGLNDARWIIKANNINVSTDLTVSGNSVLGSNSSDALGVNAKINTNVIPSANGTKSLGNTSLRWDGQFDDLTADDLTVDANASVTGHLAVTATSVLSNTLTVAGATQINNTLAAGNTTVTGFINTSSSANIGGTLEVGSTSLLDGNANVSGLLRAADSVIVTGNANVSSQVFVGANTKANTTAIKVGNSTVNTVITGSSINTDGSLDVLQAAALANSLSVTGAATLSNTVGVTGAADFANTITANGIITSKKSINILGTANVAQQLNVVKSADFSNTVTIAGNTVMSSTANVGGALNVTGGTTLGSGVTVTGGGTFSADIDGSANVDAGVAFNVGNTKVTDAVLEISANASHNVHVGIDAIHTKGNLTANGNLTLSTGTATIGKTLATGNTTVTGFINTSGKAVIGGNVVVAGDIDAANNKEANVYNLVVRNNLTSNLVQTGAHANLVSGEVYVTTSSATLTPNTTFKDDVTVEGDFTVQGTTTLASNQALSLNVATMTTLTVAGQANLNGNVVIGQTYADDEIEINGQITSGIFPSANGNAFGNTTKRWAISGTTGTFSSTGSFGGLLTIATSNQTGIAVHSGDVRIGNSTSNTIISGAGGTTSMDSTLYAKSTANVVGDLSIHSDIKNESGTPFRVLYANGDVAWP